MYKIYFLKKNYQVASRLSFPDNQNKVFLLMQRPISLILIYVKKKLHQNLNQKLPKLVVSSDSHFFIAKAFLIFI